jgi:hypothetical protein
MAKLRGPSTSELDRRADNYAALVASHVRDVLRQISQEVHDPPSSDDVARITDLWNAIVGRVLLSELFGAWRQSIEDIREQVPERLVTAAVVPDVPVVPDEAALSWLQHARNRLVGIGDAIWSVARDELITGMKLGESVPKLRDRLRASIGFSQQRATTIARTEIISASNAGAITGMRALGMTATKEWISTTRRQDLPGPWRTRESHRLADGQTVLLGEKFIIGGVPLDFPGDPTGPPDEIINCRCSLSFEVLDAQLVADAFHLPGQHNQKDHGHPGEHERSELASLVSDWEQTKPWAATRAKIEAGDVKGLRVGTPHGSEEASFEPGRGIVVKPSYFDRAESIRRAILYHEAGHGLETEVGAEGLRELGVDDPLDIINWPGAQGLGGNYSEILAEGYSALWTDPEWFKTNKADRVEALVRDMAGSRNWPIPSQAQDHARLDLKGDKRLTERQALTAARRVVDDFADFYEYDGTKPEIEVGTNVERAGLRGNRIIVSPVWVDEARDPDYGVEAFRVIAHEAAHAMVSGAPTVVGPNSKKIEEGAAEILSLNYWNQRGQEFDKRDAVRRDGQWVDGVGAMAARSVYQTEVVELLRRAASQAGSWDRNKILANVERVMRGNHNDRLKFRDKTNPDYPLPKGITAEGDHPAEELLKWFLQGSGQTASAFHLPGQHNQKTHGHQGQHKRWRTIPRSEGLKTEIDRLVHDMPDITPARAKELIGDRFDGATFLRQGEHQITVEHVKEVNKKGLDVMLGTLSDLTERFPPPQPLRVHVGLADFAFETDVTHGITIGGTGSVSINMFSLDPDTQVSKGFSPHKFMPVASEGESDEDRIRYIVAHEYGHVLTPVDYNSRGYPIRAHDAVSRLWFRHLSDGSLSAYGEAHNLEAFGEAFAEWYLTEGDTDNKAAIDYAFEFGWVDTIEPKERGRSS